ncbi:MAG: isoprenylcysteine carboxylmethyltransferase family protein [Candidatus Sulfopaludibacter sp.]|nr:isoprenylcysteine carboxylmethyltransferase family protein [Candidatus Sulfopaludibacter sp.]
MYLAALVELAVCWVVWWYPFILRAPHRQSRASIAQPGPTGLGLLLEVTAFAIALLFRLPAAAEPGLLRILPSMLLGPIAPVLGWTAVKHLGRQFRITAGLYCDHQLVHTGPYAVVRHPIYASLLAILVSTLLLLTRWPWALVSLAVFLAGTEVRVRAEDGLLDSRFGAQFQEYRRHVPAYIPWLR